MKGEKNEPQMAECSQPQKHEEKPKQGDEKEEDKSHHVRQWFFITFVYFMKEEASVCENKIVFLLRRTYTLAIKINVAFSTTTKMYNVSLINKFCK